MKPQEEPVSSGGSNTAGEDQGVPGEDAVSPQQVPARGWLQILKRGWAEAKADNVSLLAAGVAFYTFLAIVPTLTAVVFIYGLVADPGQIADQINSIGTALPADVRSVLVTQLSSLAANNTGAGIGAVVSVLLALWSASGGTTNLMTAISLAYDEEEKRSFLVKRGLALLLTVGAIITMVVVLALVAALPLLLQVIDNEAIRLVLQAVRYVILVAVILLVLAVLYRVAPDRDAPKFRWVSVGAGTATVLWLVASVGFSLYAAHGSYTKFGALASVVVLLFWLWISAYAILLGAEINAEAEQQTARDTTKGPAQPLGERGAVKADSVPEQTDQSPTTHQTEPPARAGRTVEDKKKRADSHARPTSAAESTKHSEKRTDAGPATTVATSQAARPRPQNES